LAEAGKLALGSDSRLSGEFDLLAELRVAHASNQLSPQCLFQLVTTNAARLLRLRAGGMGQVRVGGTADLVLLPPSGAGSANSFSQLFGLNRSQVALVMLAGKPLIGSAQMQPVFEATRTKFARVSLDGTEKLMSQKLVARLKKSSVQEPGLTI
jgi:cytosine/adenosine deaminase-related metal-dependent hydrolase